MPKIPDASAVGYSVPQTRTPRFTDRSGVIRAQAIGELSQTVGALTEAYTERQDKFSYARAKSSLIQADVAARRDLENDPDWATYEQRYNERMQKAREAASGLIRNKSDRALFDMDAKLDVERGVGEIRNISRRKEIDWGRASLNELMEANRTTALNASDEPTRGWLIQSTNEAIDGAKQNGYLSEVEATSLRQKWAADYADAYVGMQPAEKRIELLSNTKGTVADYIAPDRRVALLEAAQKESRDLTVRRESQAQEDAIVGKFGGNWSAALKAARDIDDPEVRDSTVGRIKIRQAEAEKAEYDYREAISEEALAFINDGGKFSDLPLRIKNGLKPSALNSLRSYAEQQASGGTRRTDPETLIQLSRLSTDDPQKFGEIDMLPYRSFLSDSDFEEFVDLQRKIRSGSLDGKATGFMTLNQVRDERLRDLFGSAMPTTKESERVSKERREFVNKYESGLKAFKDANGKTPTTDDARKILDDMTAQVVINRKFMLDKQKPAYAITINDIPDEDGIEIVRSLRERGKAVTEQAVIDLFIKVNREQVQ